MTIHHQQQQQQQQQQFVPKDHSLHQDAPGYGDDGPICWKCRNQKNKGATVCKLCHNTGRLSGRKQTRTRPGQITRGRKHRTCGLEPFPVGYSVPYYGAIVRNCTENCVDHVTSNCVPPSTKPTAAEEDGDDSCPPPPPPPSWWPQPNEQLCNLTGSYRILQKVKSHRWTTDDLVTAAVAARYLHTADNNTIRYCDLGTGNGSVLNMVLWKAGQIIAQENGSCSSTKIVAKGIEARSEAIGLARRTLTFNHGHDNDDIQLEHGDFRNFYCSSSKFDLVTGTPPYFRVTFDMQRQQTNEVETAIILQGAMPSCLQSAPARCEFRGGMEAYCEVASRIVSETQGHFVVCENYQNHERTLHAMQDYGLQLVAIWHVHGKVNRPCLFSVYVATKKSQRKSDDATVTIRTISARDENGHWTDEYRSEVLEYMAAV